MISLILIVAAIVYIYKRFIEKRGRQIESSFTPGSTDSPLENLVEDKFRTIAECVLLHAARPRADRPCYWQKENGSWTPYSWTRVAELGRRVASQLVAWGMNKGDRAVLGGPTHVPWMLSDIGVQMAGLVSVGLYQKLPVADIVYLVSHCEARVLFQDDSVEKLTRDVLVALTTGDGVNVEHVVLWQGKNVKKWTAEFPSLAGKITSLEEIYSNNEPLAEDKVLDRQGGPDDVAIFVYTSGTTGPPKGVRLPHRSLREQMRLLPGGMPITDRTLCVGFLPLGHVAQRIILCYLQFAWGFTQAFATSVPKLLEEIKEIRPTLFGSVPRLFEKVYTAIQGRKAGLTGVKRRIFDFAESSAMAKAAALAQGKQPGFFTSAKCLVADVLVLKKIRSALGGRVEYMVSGAAPIDKDILYFFFGIDLPVYELYGMTECGGAITQNTLEGWRVGSVGKPISERAEVVIDKDTGEILMRGPHLLLDYYKNPEATAKDIDSDGWLHSGDVGKIDDEGFVYITDRIKHLIITAGGKNLSSSNIENAIKVSSPLISQCVAYGDKMPYVVALVTPSPVETLGWALKHSVIDEKSHDVLVATLKQNPVYDGQDLLDQLAKITLDEKYQKDISAAVMKANGLLSHTEAVKRFHILPRDFKVGVDLTPTLKVKRRVVLQSYKDHFNGIYAGTTGVDLGKF